MEYSVQTTIVGPSRGTADTFFEWARAKGSARLGDVRLYLDTMYDLAPKVGLRADVLIGQSVHEASDHGIPWNSFWWRERCNCIGNGITGSPEQDSASRDFGDGIHIALCHLVHDWLYSVGSDLPPELVDHRDEDPRWDSAVNAGFVGIAPTIDGFTNTYAADPLYGEKWVRRLRDLDANGLFDEDGVQDDNAVIDAARAAAERAERMIARQGLTAHFFEGLDKEVWLPDDIQVVKRIIGSDKIGWVRSGQHFTGQTVSLYHETGNTREGANALAEANYLKGGPMGWNARTQRMERRLVGFNFSVDDEMIVQTVPLDEVTWSAGRPEWNRKAWGIEQAVGSSVNLEKARRNAAALHAGLAVAMGWDVRESMRQHNVVYGKDCPQIIRHRDLWPQVQRMAVEFANAAQGAIALEGHTDTSHLQVHVAPDPVDELTNYIQDGQLVSVPPAVTALEDGESMVFINRKIVANVETPRLRNGRDDSPTVGPPLQAGETVNAIWVYQASNARWYYLTAWWTRLRMDDFDFVT